MTKIPANVKQPADRLPKNDVVKASTYTMTVDGQDWDLPYAGEVAANVPYGLSEDATQHSDDDRAQAALAMAMLACAAPSDLMSRLRSMPTVEVLELAGDWMSWTPDGEESAGESSGSEG